MATIRTTAQFEARCNQLWRGIVIDRAILRGDELGPSGVSWQDVAGTMACQMRVLADLLDRARAGEIEGPCLSMFTEDPDDD